MNYNLILEKPEFLLKQKQKTTKSAFHIYKDTKPRSMQNKAY